MLRIYTEKANIRQTITPHKLRHFLFTWMKKQGIDDALSNRIQGMNHGSH
jgi:integrase/recombinase XerD